MYLDSAKAMDFLALATQRSSRSSTTSQGAEMNTTTGRSTHVSISHSRIGPCQRSTGSQRSRSGARPTRAAAFGGHQTRSTLAPASHLGDRENSDVLRPLHTAPWRSSIFTMTVSVYPDSDRIRTHGSTTIGRVAVSRNEPRRAIDSAQDRLELTADHFGVSVEWVRSVVFERRPEQWGSGPRWRLTGRPCRGGTRFWTSLALPVLSTIICPSCRSLKVSRNTWSLMKMPRYLTAWQRVTQGAEHVLAMSTQLPIGSTPLDAFTTWRRPRSQIFDGGMETVGCDVPGFLRGVVTTSPKPFDRRS